MISDGHGSVSNGVGQSYQDFLRMDGSPSASLLEARKALWELFSSMVFCAVAPQGARYGVMLHFVGVYDSSYHSSIPIW